MKPALSSWFKLTLAFLVIIACSKPEEASIIDEKIFVKIYCDIVSGVDALPYSERFAYVDSIFKHYGVSSESFQLTIKSYNQDPRRWEQVWRKIVAELEQRVNTNQKQELLKR